METEAELTAVDNRFFVRHPFARTAFPMTERRAGEKRVFGRYGASYVLVRREAHVVRHR